MSVLTKDASQSWQGRRWSATGLKAAVAAAVLVTLGHGSWFCQSWLNINSIQVIYDRRVSPWNYNNTHQLTLQTGWLGTSSCWWNTELENLHNAPPTLVNEWNEVCKGLHPGWPEILPLVAGSTGLGVIYLYYYFNTVSMSLAQFPAQQAQKQPSYRVAQRRLLPNYLHLHLRSWMFCKLLRCWVKL